MITAEEAKLKSEEVLKARGVENIDYIERQILEAIKEGKNFVLISPNSLCEYAIEEFERRNFKIGKEQEYQGFFITTTLRKISW